MTHILESIRKDIKEIDYLTKSNKCYRSRATGGLKKVDWGFNLTASQEVTFLRELDIFNGGWYPKNCTYKEKVEAKKKEYKRLCKLAETKEDKEMIVKFIDFNKSLKELVKEIQG